MKARRKGREAPDATRTIRLDLQYDGGPFVGWQRQAKGKSVQGCLEKALSKIANERITLLGASRTDAGVHAHHQVASFSLKKSRTPVEAFVRGTNTLLPGEIRIQRASEVPIHFHATTDAREKTYRYFLYVGQGSLVFLRNYVWTLPQVLNIDDLHRASEYLVGEHDFAAFRAARSQTQTSVRRVLSATWNLGPFQTLCFEIQGTGFLKHMVRNIVGTLVEIGQGRRLPHDMKAILASKDRKRAGRAAPPHGLFLWRVLY